MFGTAAQLFLQRIKLGFLELLSGPLRLVAQVFGLDIPNEIEDTRRKSPAWNLVFRPDTKDAYDAIEKIRSQRITVPVDFVGGAGGGGEAFQAFRPPAVSEGLPGAEPTLVAASVAQNAPPPLGIPIYTPSGGGSPAFVLQHGWEGIVRRATHFIAGEAGPEYVSATPLGKGGGGPDAVNIHTHVHLDGRELVKIVDRLTLRRARLAGAKLG